MTDKGYHGPWADDFFGTRPYYDYIESAKYLVANDMGAKLYRAK